MLRKQILAEIQSKEKKLLELRKILQSDTAASYKEATQTSEMIEVLELNLMDLKKILDNEKNFIKKIIAQCDNKEMVFYLVKKDGDPSLMRFSLESPFGIKLDLLRPGDELNYQDRLLKIIKIDEK
jgi:transcription elongation GreA/GreB family factor